MSTSERSAAEFSTIMTEKLAGFQIAQALYAVAKLGSPEALLGVRAGSPSWLRRRRWKKGSSVA